MANEAARRTQEAKAIGARLWSMVALVFLLGFPVASAQGVVVTPPRTQPQAFGTGGGVIINPPQRDLLAIQPSPPPSPVIVIVRVRLSQLPRATTRAAPDAQPSVAHLLDARGDTLAVTCSSGGASLAFIVGADELARVRTLRVSPR